MKGMNIMDIAVKIVDGLIWFVKEFLAKLLSVAIFAGMVVEIVLSILTGWYFGILLSIAIYVLLIRKYPAQKV